jgi:predicted DNA-binding antitoxin AbrB/MazE fold protein
MQACRAIYNSGRFVPLEPIVIPEGSQAIVTVLDFTIDDVKPIIDTDDVCRRQAEAMRRFRESIRNSDEPVPNEFERVKLREVEM